MSNFSHEAWLESVLPNHERLTQAVVSIMESVLREQKIDYLAVSGRTKAKKSALEKISRKGYANPITQMTDLSGIRIVVYFESDVKKVSKIIHEAFCVDESNSSNKDVSLSTDKIGYRSVHYVCDLGSGRENLPEHKGLGKLKFEFQVRTVLQHAWAELAHDRNYKFSGKLPQEVERKLYLYAGLLEIADRGFDETALEIDKYAESLRDKASHGDLDIEITSLSLRAFVEEWVKNNNVDLGDSIKRLDVSVLVRELSEFGISKISELAAIVPEKYASVLVSNAVETSIYGVVRDWMIISDWRKFKRKVKIDWMMDDDGTIEEFLSKEDYREFLVAFDLLCEAEEDEDFVE